MAHVTLPEVQQWLEKTKLDLTSTSFDAELEKTATALVFSSLGEVYDTTTWTNDTTTPELVRKIISLFVAAWTYERAYSEDDLTASGYSEDLEATANDLLVGIVSGVIDLIDVPGLPGTASGPTYWPNDSTGSSAVYDGLGNLIAFEGSEDIKFTMGGKF